ncbi:MAG: Uncharacterised protein [Flavobacterium sp. SCGC AAA160-P02]|nr:MAG: Uncharacterised protein [Flavobacterium sp. SCGC AAA160-P02]
MRAHSANLLNSISLIVMPLWGYLTSENPSVTALIPAIVGVILLLCYTGVKKENKIIAHVAVLLTLIILFALIKPLSGAIDRADNLAIVRVLIMILTTIFALVKFVQSFIEARKNREK